MLGVKNIEKTSIYIRCAKVMSVRKERQKMSDLDLMIYVDTILALIVVAFLIKSLIDEDIRKAKKISEILKKYERGGDT